MSKTDDERVEEIRADHKDCGDWCSTWYLLRKHDEQKELREEIEWLREFSAMVTSERCAKYGAQACHVCERMDCGDNISPAKREIDRLREALEAVVGVYEKWTHMDEWVDTLDAFEKASLQCRKALGREGGEGDSG